MSAALVPRTSPSRHHVSRESKADAKGGEEAAAVRSDPSLDFFSPDFDALKALYTRNLLPPNPKVTSSQGYGLNEQQCISAICMLHNPATETSRKLVFEINS
jgi:hypothetical protein